MSRNIRRVEVEPILPLVSDICKISLRLTGGLARKMESGDIDIITDDNLTIDNVICIIGQIQEHLGQEVRIDLFFPLTLENRKHWKDRLLSAGFGKEVTFKTPTRFKTREYLPILIDDFIIYSVGAGFVFQIGWVKRRDFYEVQELKAERERLAEQERDLFDIPNRKKLILLRLKQNEIRKRLEWFGIFEDKYIQQ